METTPEEVLAEFCRDLATLRTLARVRARTGTGGISPRVQLENIVRAAREGRDITPLWSAYAGPDDEDEWGGSPRLLPEDGYPATDSHVGVSHPPVAGVFVCPDGLCAREERRRLGEGPPECLVRERVLRFLSDG